MKKDLFDLEREHNKLLKRNRDVRYAAWMRLVQECADREAMVAWCQTPEVRQTMPDMIEYPERPLKLWLETFYSMAMP